MGTHEEPGQTEEPQGCCAPARRPASASSPPARHSPSALHSPSARHSPPAPPARGGTPASSLPERVRLPGGTFSMGTDDAEGFPHDGEGPVRPVTVSPFAIDATAVTNDAYAAFVDDTGYRTETEAWGWSFVFAGFLPPAVAAGAARPPGTPWWCAVPGADWRAPEGAGSDLAGRADHPVVQVSFADAVAYCSWAGGRLPSEAEWEYAARGGLHQARYAWGDELTPDGVHRCNIWQGRFPVEDTGADGYRGTAPVRSFPPNGHGLYEVAGNVWEWTADWWGTRHEAGPATDPTGPPQGTARVMRGGSYLCHASYCNRYRVAARTSNDPDSAGGNLGFRCAYDA